MDRAKCFFDSTAACSYSPANLWTLIRSNWLLSWTEKLASFQKLSLGSCGPLLSGYLFFLRQRTVEQQNSTWIMNYCLEKPYVNESSFNRSSFGQF